MPGSYFNFIIDLRTRFPFLKERFAFFFSVSGLRGAAASSSSGPVGGGGSLGEEKEGGGRGGGHDRHIAG